MQQLGSNTLARFEITTVKWLAQSLRMLLSVGCEKVGERWKGAGDKRQVWPWKRGREINPCFGFHFLCLVPVASSEFNWWSLSVIVLIRGLLPAHPMTPALLPTMGYTCSISKFHFHPLRNGRLEREMCVLKVTAWPCCTGQEFINCWHFLSMSLLLCKDEALPRGRCASQYTWLINTYGYSANESLRPHLKVRRTKEPVVSVEGHV